ncbi:MAG TPA: hypothetical protein VML92_06410 [Steroidobacteraceae bacterium]|nr:hypothetical protein [Steroidobacteraceae bacterium]
MKRQQPLALAPPAGSANWSERSLLDGLTRRALCSINLAFLDLATDLAEEGRLKLISGLPPRAVDALIDPDAGKRLCERLPYALFDLRFGDGGFWESEIAAAGGVQDAEPAVAADDRIVVFARAAIMLAWHLAQTRAAGARLVFGISPATIAALASLPVATMERLARRVAPALTARFGTRARFWLQFEGCAVRPDEQSVNMLQQLGLQIQGAESARSQALQRRTRRVIVA